MTEQSTWDKYEQEVLDYQKKLNWKEHSTSCVRQKLGYKYNTLTKSTTLKSKVYKR